MVVIDGDLLKFSTSIVDLYALAQPLDNVYYRFNFLCVHEVCVRMHAGEGKLKRQRGSLLY